MLLAQDAPDALFLDLPDLAHDSERGPFTFCLNTSTLRGFKLPIDQIVEIAASAGYDAIEPWISELDEYEKNGGDLLALGAKLHDLKLKVAGAIGFFDWMNDDPAARAIGLIEARRSMRQVAAIGGKWIAAPAFGVHAPGSKKIDLLDAAARYHELLVVGDETGVVPLVEVWGFSANLSRLGEAALIASESGHQHASILADVYHLYKGGSPTSALNTLNGKRLPLFHVNDYPEIPPAQINDSDRVYPGDGIAPLEEIFRVLHDIGFRGALSLELFNESYWTDAPENVARTGLAKLRAAVDRSLG